MAVRQRRFIYWTADGKRHWTPHLGITLGLSESRKFRSADKLYNCELHCNEPREVERTSSATRPEKEQAR